MPIKKGVDAVLEVLSHKLGFDPKDENFKDTPERVEKLYKEMFLPPEIIQLEIEKIFEKVFPTTYSGIILIPEMVTYSMCPHHLLPVEYHVTVAYLPNQISHSERQVLGLSKPIRIVEVLSKLPILQEDYTQKIADTFMRIAKGVAVVTVGIHGCMRCRGVRTRSPAVMSVMTGPFMTEPKVREEFYFLLNYSRNFVGR